MREVVSSTPARTRPLLGRSLSKKRAGVLLELLQSDPKSARIDFEMLPDLLCHVVDKFRCAFLDSTRCGLGRLLRQHREGQREKGKHYQRGAHLYDNNDFSGLGSGNNVTERRGKESSNAKVKRVPEVPDCVVGERAVPKLCDG